MATLLSPDLLGSSLWAFKNESHREKTMQCSQVLEEDAGMFGLLKLDETQILEAVLQILTLGTINTLVFTGWVTLGRQRTHVGSFVLTLRQLMPFTLPLFGGGGLVAKSCLTLGTPWTVTCQAPLSMEFLRKNTGVGCYFFLQGTFLTQGSNWSLLCLLHVRQILYLLRYQGSPLFRLVPWKHPVSEVDRRLVSLDLLRGDSE